MPDRGESWSRDVPCPAFRRAAVPWAILVAVVVALPVPGQPPGEPSLTVTFEPAAVTVVGAAEGDRLALLGVGRARTAYRSRMLRFDGVVTTDGEGTARDALPDDQPVPVRSVWAVVGGA